VRLAPPGLGEQSEDILTELGYRPEQISELRAKRAIRWTGTTRGPCS